MHIASFSLVVLVGTATAQAAPLTLEHAIEQAQSVSPIVRAAQARLQQAEGRSTIARYLVPSNPRLIANATTDRLLQNQGEGAVDVGVEQELEIFGQRGLRIAMSDAELAAFRLELEAARARVRADVESSYYELLFQERRIAALRAAVEQAARVEEAARRRAAAGDIGEAEHTLIAADLATARADALAAEADRKAVAARVAVLAGKSPTEAVTTTGELPAGAAIPALDAWLALARQRRPDLRAAAAALAAGDREIALRKRERLPNPTLSIGYARDRGVFAGDDVQPRGIVTGLSDVDQFLVAGIAIPLPLLRSGKGEIAEARGRRAETAANRDVLAFGIATDVAAAHARYEEARQRAIDLGNVESTLAATLARYETAYLAGKLDLAAYLTVRDRVLRAQLAALTARRDAAVAGAQLRVAAGGTPGAS